MPFWGAGKKTNIEFFHIASIAETKRTDQTGKA